MRIVFVNRIGWPDEGATALYLTDVAEACAAEGHETHVVCGEAAYRATGIRQRLPTVHRGVRYHRVPGRRGTGTLDRALASAGFLARAAARLVRLRRPDVVVGLTDPPFADVLAGVIARLRDARSIPWIMDLYPDVAVAAHVVRPGSFADRGLGAVMGASLRHSASVVVLGRSMRRPVLARGVPRRRIRVIENWAPTAVEEAVPRATAPRPDRPFTLLYSGTYGVAHDLSPLLDALRTLPSSVPARLVIRASGSRMGELRHAANGLPIPVLWRDPVPVGELASSLREADLHVVCIRAGFERLVVPSKMYAPLALGLPVLLMGPGARRLAPRAVREVAPMDAPSALLAALSGPTLCIVALPRTLGLRVSGRAEWLALLASRRSGARPDPL